MGLAFGDAEYLHGGLTEGNTLNTAAIHSGLADWYEKANRDPNTLEGIANIFYMTCVVGHETAHWGNQIKGPTGEELDFLHKFDNKAGRPEHGEAFDVADLYS